MYSETDSSDDEQDMYPAPVRRSERNKEKVANNERERRRNEQWANQGQRAQQFNNPVYVQPPQNDIPMEEPIKKKRKGFTEEQRRKAMETRRNNNECTNCGQRGHYKNECVNEKVRRNNKIPNVGEFDPVKAFYGADVPIKWAQYLNENPSVRKKLKRGLKN
jgi:hypothetical protein